MPNIALLDLENTSNHYINKEMNGGLGRRIELNGSFRSRMLVKFAKRFFYTPPISLAYIGAIFEKRGMKVSLFNDVDIPADTDCALFQSSIADFKNDLQAAKILRKRFPRLKIGFTGAFPTFRPDLYLEAGDFVISGEPETAAQGLFDTIDPSGIIKTEPPSDLDRLPFPKWDLLLNGSNHHRFSRNIRGLPIYASRGCSFTCSYCPYISYFGRTRMRKVENVFLEIETIVKKWGIKRFLFRDPDFTENKKRVFALMEMLIKSKLNIHWSCETRLDLVDEELLQAMKNAGCVEIGTGIESVSPEILKDVERKAITDERIRKMTNFAHRIGILIQANYIIGLPEDSNDSIKSTMEYASSLNTPLANFSIFTPYPGTKAWPEFEKKITDSDLEKFDLAHLVFKHQNLSEQEIRTHYNKAYDSYYFRFSWFRKNLKPVVQSLI